MELQWLEVMASWRRSGETGELICSSAVAGGVLHASLCCCESKEDVKMANVELAMEGQYARGRRCCGIAGITDS